MGQLNEAMTFADAVAFVGPVTLPAGTVSDADVAAGANLDASKMQHRHKLGTNFDLPIGSLPVAREEIVFVATAAGTIHDFQVVLNDTGTSTDVDFDLKKNGVSVLSAVVNMTHADTDATPKAGTLSVTAFVAGDVFSIQLIITIVTGTEGPFACAEFDELAA